jgi:hypothetical protein
LGILAAVSAAQVREARGGRGKIPYHAVHLVEAAAPPFPTFPDRCGKGHGTLPKTIAGLPVRPALALAAASTVVPRGAATDPLIRLPDTVPRPPLMRARSGPDAVFAALRQGTMEWAETLPSFFKNPSHREAAPGLVLTSQAVQP